MAARSTSTSASKRVKRSVRHQFQLSFSAEELRDSFLTRLEGVKKQLFPGRSVDNAHFMIALLDEWNHL